MGGMQYGDTFQNALFQNPGTDHKWITLKLEGTKSNRSAIGAQVELVVQTDEGQRLIYRSVSSGGSFGANSLQLEIGLGEAIAIDLIQVTWPGTGLVQIYQDIPFNGTFKLKEGDEALTVLSPSVVKFAAEPMGESTHGNH